MQNMNIDYSSLEEKIRRLQLNQQSHNNNVQDVTIIGTNVHSNQYGFMNNASRMEHINNQVTHYLSVHEASMDAVELRIQHLCTNINDINNGDPPWRGQVVSMAQDKSNCQSLQEVIEEGNPIYVELIISEVKGYVHVLMTHPFGNLLIQKLLEANINWDVKDYFVYMIMSNARRLRDVCMDNHGTRVMQTMLTNITHFITKYDVARTMKLITDALMKNANGGYVIIHCVRIFPPPVKKMILDEVARDCVEIARDKIGCSFIQKCLSYGGEDNIIGLVKKIILNAMVLAEDPHGNYVLQCVIKMELRFREFIVKELRGKFVRLSINKYGSNVVEDLLIFSNNEYVEFIVAEIMSSHYIFLNVIEDPFGNYVVQRALKCTQGYLRKELSNLIVLYRTRLCSHPHGRKVLKMAMTYLQRLGNYNNF